MNKSKFQYKPIFILFLIISTTILLIYSLGNDKAVSFIKYFSYLYSTISLIVVLFNIKRFYLYIKSNILNTKRLLYLLNL